MPPTGPMVMGAAEVPEQLRAYMDLPIAEMAKELDKHIAQDLSSSALYLSDVVGALPANMTPVMAWWFNWIAGWRQPALEAVRNAFHQDRVPGGFAGQLFEAKQDDIEQRLVTEKREAYRMHLERNRDLHNRVQDQSMTVQQDREAFFQRKAEHGGREPVIWHWALYAPFLLAILVAESFVNYEAFLAIKWFTPFTALGATLIVAGLIASASHYHGSLLKQFNHFFGEHRRDIHRGPAWRIFALSSVGLSVALSAVWYARGIHLGELSAIQDALGEKGDLSQLSTVGGSLLLNLGVWLMGVFVAWAAHDPDPEYPRMKKKLLREEAKLSVLTSTVEKAIERELRRVQATADEERKRLHALNEQQKRSGANYRFNQDLLGKLKSKDQQVLAELSKYRNQLVHQMQTGQPCTFFVCEPYPADSWKPLTPDEYKRTELKMVY